MYLNWVQLYRVYRVWCTVRVVYICTRNTLYTVYCIRCYTVLCSATCVPTVYLVSTNVLRKRHEFNPGTFGNISVRIKVFFYSFLLGILKKSLKYYCTDPKISILGGWIEDPPYPGTCGRMRGEEAG